MAKTFWDGLRNYFRAGWSQSPIDYSSRRTQRKLSKGKLQGDVTGFGDIFDRYGMLGADSKGYRSSKTIGNGGAFSNTQLAEMQYNHDEAQIDRDWNERMYNMYQSPEAQMRQYQEAGLNPALMYQGGVDVNGPSGGSAASTSGADGGEDPQSGFERVMGVMSQFLNMITGASNIGQSVVQLKNQTSETRATVEEKKAHAANLEADTAGKQLSNQITAAFGMAEAYYKNEQSKASIASTYQNIRESISRISLNNSTIELNGEKIVVAKSEAGLNWAKANLTKFTEEQGRALLEPSKRLLNAQIALTRAQTAKTSEEAAQVELDAVARRNAEYAQAAKDLAQAAVTNGLLDNDYCKSFVDYYNRQGDAALVNAYSNWLNAGTNARNAATNERNAATNEYNARTQRVKVATDVVFDAIGSLSKLSISAVPGATAGFGGFPALPAGPAGLPALPAGSPLPLP